MVRTQLITSVPFVRAHTVKSLSHVTVVTMDLKLRWKIVLNEPSVRESLFTSSDRLTMLVTASFFMVHCKKFINIYATTNTLTTVVTQH